MVVSRILKAIDYNENPEIDEIDEDSDMDLYLYPIRDNHYKIVIGNLNFKYLKDEIAFVPIYLVTHDDEIESKIGVFEFNSAYSSAIIDEDGDLNGAILGEPLLFSNITDSFLMKHRIQVEDSDDEQDEEDEEEKEESQKLPVEQDESDSDDEQEGDDMFEEEKEEEEG
jgi:hypothetical protein